MKVLIIGLGSIAQKHIEALKTIDKDVSFYALRSSKNAGTVPSISNIFEVGEISTINPDFIIISNPTATHLSTLQSVAQFNIPLFIEKPLFSTLTNNALELVNKITDKNIPTYVACNLRFLDCISKIKEEIQGQKINEVNIYCGSFLPEWRPNIDFRRVYSANQEMGGGVHLDLIHELDYVYWIFGAPKATASIFTNNSSLKISAYDYANYVWRYNTFTVNTVLNYYRRDAKRTLEILTDSDTYLVDLLNNSIYRNKELIFKSKQSVRDTYLEQMKFFIDEVKNKRRLFNPIKEAYAVLELCLKD